MRLLVAVLCLALIGDPLVGKRMPPISGVTIHGKKIDEAYFNGKVTLVSFMFIGCKPCVYELADLPKLHKYNYFQVLLVAPHSFKTLRAYERQHQPFTFDVLPECETEDHDCSPISRAYRVNGYPKTVLIDKRGVVRYVHLGFDSTGASLKEIQRDINTLVMEK